tara:strand:+ start:1941 stop:2792 length:852 start_codon:yes stop_codon:yes gene_type:complete
MEAAKHHEENWEDVFNKALEEANIKPEDIDLVAYARGPGMGPCLRVGLKAAEEIAKLANLKETVGINHCIAHLSIGTLIDNAKDPVILYVSGANTQVIALEGEKYRIFGETLDMGCGNFIDTFARLLGLGFPGGPKIDELAKKGKNFLELPYSVKGMDVSFSGLFTHLKQRIEKGEKNKEDLAYSVQETAFSMVTEVAERAMAHCNKEELILGGGVCCNSRLQDMTKKMCKQRGAKVIIPDFPLLLDNGAMIAWQGFLERKNKSKELLLRPYERTDEVEVNWL